MKLIEMAYAYNKEVKEALETVYNELNKGQQKKLLKSAVVKALFIRYGIIEEGD